MSDAYIKPEVYERYKQKQINKEMEKHKQIKEKIMSNEVDAHTDECYNVSVTRNIHVDYLDLFNILQRAYCQAAEGKGAERHGKDVSFSEQPMQDLINLYGPGFALGQAAKKTQESLRLPTTPRKVTELLGAINYIAGTIIYLENSK